AEPLEERRLRLHDPHHTGKGAHRTQGELTQPCDVPAQPPGGEQTRVRIDAHAQRPQPVGHRGESLPERGREAPALASIRLSRAASCSCNERTWNGPRRIASIACTAAVNCCT